MGALVIIIIILALAALLYLQYKIAEEFFSTAVEKGWDNRCYFWYSFFLGIVGYLMVIALPDRNCAAKTDSE